MIDELGRRDRLLLLTLSVGGKPIAMKINIIAADGAGSFALKIAYDADYARYSPGVLLELENIADLHRRADTIAWMDSCADPHHPMIDRLWRERRVLVYVLCAGRGLVGRALMALFTMRHRRWTKKLEQADG